MKIINLVKPELSTIRIRISDFSDGQHQVQVMEDILDKEKLYLWIIKTWV